MKKLIFILCLVLLNSYSYSNPSYNDRLLENIKKGMPKEISKKRLVERRGLVYEVNSTIPFTGTATDSLIRGWISERINYKDGILHGVWEEYHNDIKGEVLEHRSTWRNGVLHGVNENYILNISTDKAVLVERKNYKNGVPDGRYELYSWEKCRLASSYICSDSNSALLKEIGNYKDGKRNGRIESFHDNGQLAMRGNFKDGKQDGLWMQFWNNGELQMKANFKDGKGLAEFFDEEGNFVGTQEYENGVLQE